MKSHNFTTSMLMKEWCRRSRVPKLLSLFCFLNVVLLYVFLLWMSDEDEYDDSTGFLIRDLKTVEDLQNYSAKDWNFYLSRKRVMKYRELFNQSSRHLHRNDDYSPRYENEVPQLFVDESRKYMSSFKSKQLKLTDKLSVRRIRSGQKQQDVFSEGRQRRDTYLHETDKDESEEEIDDVNLADLTRRLRASHLGQTAQKPKYELDIHMQDATESIMKAFENNKILNRRSSRPSNAPYNITIYVQDYNLDLLSALKLDLHSKGVRFIDRSLSPLCDILGKCPRKGSVVRYFYDQSASAIERFYQENHDDADIQQSDAFLCIQPPSLCQLYTMFDKPMIVMVTARYEQGRGDTEYKWNSWNRYIEQMMKSDQDVLAATNTYDIEYLRYFTSVEAMHLPPLCSYITETYRPTRKDFLLYPIQKDTFSEIIMNEWKIVTQMASNNVSLIPMKTLYPSYASQHALVQHPGIVLIPHEVSFLRFIEFYRMNIPLFIPSSELLTKWHVNYAVMTKRTLIKVRGERSMKSIINGKLSLPDPNNDVKTDAVGFWMMYADFYMYPGIIYFSSLSHLAQLLQLKNNQLAKYTKQMVEYNQKAKSDIHGKWFDILDKITKQKRKRN